MTTVERPATVESPKLISVEEYLAAELVSPVKHEYVGGQVYMMAGARNVHNIISGNIYASLHNGLRGKPCRPFNSDTKVHIVLPTQVRFYYPDVQVVCKQNPQSDSYQDEPTVVVEVLSRSTRRIDEGEKKDAYLTIPSLAVYLLVETESATITAFRRTEQGFVRQVHCGLETTIALAEVDAALPLAEVYETVQFVPEPADDQGRG
ncbi:MAG TPA: Uma2 family endonuclease [Pirellulales bacterium]|nr:Uma2 family endonuclease [Pirellulales bacterium]